MASFRDMKRIDSRTLNERLDMIKELAAPEHEHYSIMKDRITGEHYLVYAYDHIDVAAGGRLETFHHLLPLNEDDVLAIVLGEQDYRYPDRWHASYLRNGPDGQFVWFDASSLRPDRSEEESGKAVERLLLDFKRRGRYDEEAIRELFERVDRELPPDDQDH